MWFVVLLLVMKKLWLDEDSLRRVVYLLGGLFKLLLIAAHGWGVWIQWNGMVVEWNDNKLNTLIGFHLLIRPPLNKDHLLIKTTQI